MNLITLNRLDLLAAAKEAQAVEAVRRQQTVLAQVDYQRGVLAAYRLRLAASWQNGAVLAAGQAGRAETFVAASDEAATQIGQLGQQADAQLVLLLAQLAEVRTTRRQLAEMQRKLTMQAIRESGDRQASALQHRTARLTNGPVGA
jgi:hypothetical protein